MLVGVVAIVATSLDYKLSGPNGTIAPIIGAAILTLLAFLAPAILTEGFNKPIPNSDHLAIGSKRFRSFLFVLAFCLLFGPGILRMLGRLVGAA